MKTKIGKPHSFSFTLLFVIFLAINACSKPNPDEFLGSKIYLNKNELTLMVGSSERLEAHFDPSDIENTGHIWSSNNSKIASVDETGLVSAISKGEATITVKALNGGATDKCIVTIEDIIFSSPSALNELTGGMVLEKDHAGVYGFSLMTVNNISSATWSHISGTTTSFNYNKNGDTTAKLITSNTDASGVKWYIAMDLEFYSNSFGKYYAIASRKGRYDYERGFFRITGNGLPTIPFTSIYNYIENDNNRIIGNPKEAVDLGLSVKWASCNIGASTPEERGDYFAWGETETKSTYTESNCATHQNYIDTDWLERNGFTDSWGVLTMTYDAAHVKWGGNWRMPTHSEIKELINNCTVKWTTQKGIYGIIVTGKNGNSIFLPAAGMHMESNPYWCENNHGYFWSSTAGYYFNMAKIILFDFEKSKFSLSETARDYGLPVRPVCK